MWFRTLTSRWHRVHAQRNGLHVTACRHKTLTRPQYQGTPTGPVCRACARLVGTPAVQVPETPEPVLPIVTTLPGVAIVRWPGEDPIVYRLRDNGRRYYRAKATLTRRVLVDEQNLRRRFARSQPRQQQEQ